VKRAAARRERALPPAIDQGATVATAFLACVSFTIASPMNSLR
jgi:hypothetical protein